MTKYIKMDAQELAEYILSKPFGEIITVYTEFDTALENDELDDDNVGMEYLPFQKLELPIGEYVVAGEYHGGHRGIFDISKEAAFRLDADIKEYLDEVNASIVAVEIEQEAQGDD